MFQSLAKCRVHAVSSTAAHVVPQDQASASSTAPISLRRITAAISMLRLKRYHIASEEVDLPSSKNICNVVQAVPPWPARCGVASRQGSNFPASPPYLQKGSSCYRHARFDSVRYTFGTRNLAQAFAVIDVSITCSIRYAATPSSEKGGLLWFSGVFSGVQAVFCCGVDDRCTNRRVGLGATCIVVNYWKLEELAVTVQSEHFNSLLPRSLLYSYIDSILVFTKNPGGACSSWRSSRRRKGRWCGRRSQQRGRHGCRG